jgi:diphthamide synthase (EF-2-diphthine--ammonia ligase)
MRRALDEASAELGISHVAFGDLFLEDVRQYRESRMKGAGIKPLFPLCGPPARAMVRAGLRARITCIAQALNALCGRQFDDEFVDDLPEGIDLCGEYGEFHSFATDGPAFREPISVVTGDIAAHWREVGKHKIVSLDDARDASADRVALT